MPLYNPQLDDEVIVDGSVPISGINNSLPPSAIDRTYAADAENRLSQLDALNRPRPGIIRLKQTPVNGLDSINHLGTGVFLASYGPNWYKYDNRSSVLSTLTGGPAFPAGAQVYGSLANSTLYFSKGTNQPGDTSQLCKYTQASTVTFTGNTHSNIVIDGIVSAGALSVGMTVTGTGIPAGTTIVSVASDGSSVNISANATTTATGVSLTGTMAAGFGTVTLPANGPYCAFPMWAVYRLIYAYQNTLIVSDALNPESFLAITGSVTLDPVANDVITGQALWQIQQLVVFRNGSTWVIQTGPGLDVPDWEVSRISATVGCRCHGTIVQTETDVIFLSETGRGVYMVSQAPATNQQGVWEPASLDVQDYINRINWSACDNARATYWNDLYILSVPLDGSTFNNFCLIYSVSLSKWQGTWCLDIGGTDVAVRDFARDRTDPNFTVLLLTTREGIISRMTYPIERQYYDQNIDGSRQYYDSSLLTRSFTNMSLRTETYTLGEDITQVRPHSARFQFLESVDPVTVTVIANRSSELTKRSLDTSNYLLSLTIPGFPFDLDVEGYKNATIALLGVGICTEFQFQFEGSGNWAIYQIKTAAFPSMPLIAS